VAFEIGSMQPTGAAVAYGLHAASGCVLDVTRALIDTGGYGFFGASGTIGVHHGIITSQLDAAGASSNAMIMLDDVRAFGNARDDVIQQADLPSAASLSPPSPVCPPGGCM
jgi:hypothetical protein